MVYGKKFWYQMQYGVGDFQYGMEMEWKKIARMKYGKIVFHSITYHPLVTEALSFFLGLKCTEGGHKVVKLISLKQEVNSMIRSPLLFIMGEFVAINIFPNQAFFKLSAKTTGFTFIRWIGFQHIWYVSTVI